MEYPKIDQRPPETVQGCLYPRIRVTVEILGAVLEYGVFRAVLSFGPQQGYAIQ